MALTNAKFVELFSAGAANTMEMVLGEVPTPGAIGMESSGSTSHQVNVIIGVTGAAQGHITLGMSLLVADRIASAMIGKRCITFDALAASAICELTNMICGCALTELAELEHVCDITPPTIIRGTKVRILNVAIPAATVPMTLSHGDISLSIALRTQRPVSAAA